MTLGQAIGGGAGAIGGFLLGGPSGAILGFQIGMGIGSFIDPPSAEEPNQSLQQQDLQFNTFARNLPIPIVYGTCRVAGNIIWIGNTFTEVVERESTEGGKGAPEPPKTREVWYHADFAMALSEGEIAGVDQVKVDDEDFTDTEGLNYTVYDGDAAQVADSLVVQALGANAPAFRNTGYLRFTGRLGRANRVPNVTAVLRGLVLTGDTFTDSFSRSNAGSLGPDWAEHGALSGAWSVASNQARTEGIALPNWARIGVVASAFNPTKNMRVSVVPMLETLSGTLPGVIGLEARVQSLTQEAYALIAIPGVGGNRDQHILHLVRFTAANSYVFLVGSVAVPYRPGNVLTLVVSESLVSAEVNGYPVIPPKSDGTIRDAGFAGMIAQTGTRYLDTFMAGIVANPKEYPVTFSDDFNRGPTTDLGTRWMPHQSPVLSNEWEIQGSVAFISQGFFAREWLVPGAINIDPDMTASVTLVDLALNANPPGSGQLIGRGVEIRAQNSSQAAYIGTIQRVSSNLAIQSEGQLVQIGLATSATSLTVLKSAFLQPQVVASGDRFGLTGIGPTLSLFINSVSVLQVADSTIQSAGTAGLFFNAAGAQGAPGRLDDFQAHANGNLGRTGAETSVFATGNPAIEVKDLLTNARYGLGLSLARIDRPSFEVGAAYCDALVRAPDATLEKRFVLDIVLDQSRPIPDHLRDMLATFRGFLVWSSGKVKLRIEQAEAVSQSFDMGTIVADSLQWRRQSYRDRPNVIRVEYINAADDHRHDFVEAFDDWDIDTTGERRERIVRLQGIKRSSQAQRMAQFYLDQAIHAVHACTFRVGIAALKAEVGDVVEVSHDVPAWVAKKFRILQIEEAEDDELTLSCLEYNAAIYHDEANAVQPSLAQPLNAAALPYHVGRFTAYKRRNEDIMELAFTRLQSADQFAGALMYRRRGTGGDFVQLDGTALALAPTAYLDSEVRSIAKTATGSPAGAIGGNSFFDPFSRTSQASLGADWAAELGPADYRVQSHRLWRAEEYVRVARANSPHTYWRLGEGSGGASADELGRVPGSYFNTPSLGQAGALIDDGDAAALFVGSAHQRTAPSSWLTIGSKDFSMEMWLAFTATSFGVPWGIRREDSPTNPSVQGLFSVNLFSALFSPGISSGWIEWSSWAAGSASTRLRTASWYGDGSYHHAVAVYKVASNHAELWVDASLVDSRAQLASSPIDVASAFASLIGGNIAGVNTAQQFYGGKADEVALYPFALTQSQVVAHYRTGLGSGTFDTPSGPTSSVVARTSAHSLVTDPEVTAKMADSRLVGFGPRIGLAARWQAGGDYGQFYYLEYMTRTLSHAVKEIGLYRVTSGPVTTLLSASFVTSGTYFTLPDSPTTFALKLTSFTLEGKLNGAVIVSAVDSTIQGAGEAGFARIAGVERYPDVVHPDSPIGYWRLGESTGAAAAEEFGRFPGSYFGAASLGQVGAIVDDRNTAVLFTNSGIGMKSILSSVLAIGSADFSLEVWARFTNALSVSFPAIVRNNVTVGTSVGIQGGLTANRTPGFVNFETWATLDPNTRAFTINTINDGSFHHLVGVYHVGSNYTELFLDGVFQSSRYQGNSYMVDPRSPFRMNVSGNFDPAFSFPGAVDEVAYYRSALSSARILAHYRAGIGSGGFVRTQGERWDDLTWIASGEATVNSPVLVRALPEGWAARLFSPTSALLASALASLGEASMVLDVAGDFQPTSGFLQVFKDQSFAAWAPDGRLPSSGFADFRGGDVYLYDRDLGFVTAVQSFLPIYNAKGGFANIGSVRLRAEEMGYSTFTDSRLEGVTRGAAGSPATSHSNLMSLGAFVVTTGAVGSQTLLDLTAAAANPLSNMPFFADNSSYVYLGGPSRFSRMGMFLERNASSVVSMAYEYSTGDGTWASLVLSGFIGPTDLTSGLRQSGPIFVEPAGDWNPTNRVASGGASIGDASSRYYLRMLRTSSLLATPPRELEILLDGDLLVAGRKENAYLYAPTVQDSMQALFFKAIAVGVQGQMAEGTKAPVTHVWSG